ncbi:hypothetical protein [Methylobacterium aerolatum]|uniref:Lipid-binding transport protein (Tim44 family) n=1 Tax=Methylobacterium aerolatum TaxID=418708 RepID=A0ABU0I7P4_9HYPH|nr:hypothetical protein [Methylobacterium aerolatum]MDQ0449669.1 putative lipid-binding transport protein (Tim44 family) [Methylobacterium aerolatum]GJD36043.1 hypothetical protein FMGBMHLM_2957 [Methylobacterium aerolatum]
MIRVLAPAGLIGLALGLSVLPASALTTKECSVKYQAAKQANTLGGKTWNDFRKAECGADAQPAAATTTVPNPVAPGAAKPSPTAAPAPAPSPAPSATAATAGSAGFPARVDPKYASEPAGKQRMHTCLDSYNAAKAAGTLGSLKWIQKGGGYYSECNKRLKG